MRRQVGRQAITTRRDTARPGRAHAKQRQPAPATGLDARPESISRVLSLSDGVFSVAMTLLVLGLQVPDLPAQHSEADLARSLLALWPSYLNYALGFLIAGAFWLGHHQILRYVRRVDRRFLWLNLLSLLSIGGIPFVTLVLSRYIGERAAVDSFAAYMALVALLQFVLWLDASHQARLIDAGVDPQAVAYRTHHSLFIVAVFAGSIVVSFWSPLAAQVTWALIWVIFGVAHVDLGRFLGRRGSRAA